MNAPNQEISTDCISLCFVGDLYLGAGEIRLDEPICHILNQADLTIGNLESAITEHPPVAKDKITLKSAPGQEEKLASWGFNIMTLANNHIFDCGVGGFRDTIKRLKINGIDYLGSGDNLSMAIQPVIRVIKDLRIGFLAFAGKETQARQATKDQPGCAPLNDDLITEQIIELRQSCDHVIVLPHWGFCDYEYPTADVYKLGQRMIEVGATAVIGHHSHIVQGIYHTHVNNIIAYSLGDFLFSPYQGNNRMIHPYGIHAKGIILRVRLDRHGILDYDTVFTRLTRDSIVTIDHNNKRKIHFRKISQELHHKNYPIVWKSVVRKRLLRRMFFWISPWNWRYIRKTTFVGLWIMIRNTIVRHN